MTARGPWYITAAACRDYMAITGLPDTEAGFAAAEDALIELASATVASGRVPAPMRSGALRYRGPRPARLTLIVTVDPRPEGPLPQLVRVMSSHEGRAG